MKNFRLPLALLAFFSMAALTAQAAELATAKVMGVVGTVTKYSVDGGNVPLQKGDILKQGDSISVTALSETKLVFSNGSELLVEENTSISLSELSQDAFGGDQSYEQLEADPSKSQVLLELNYGSLNGHVKKLQTGSKFDIATPLGTAAIRGTTFRITLRFNAERGEFILSVKNKDGTVKIISRYVGSFEYGKGNIGDKGYDSGVSNETEEDIPVAHTIIIRLHPGDPFFDVLFDLIKNYIPEDDRPDPTDKDKIILKIITPEDPGIDVVSPDTNVVSPDTQQ